MLPSAPLHAALCRTAESTPPAPTIIAFIINMCFSLIHDPFNSHLMTPSMRRHGRKPQPAFLAVVEVAKPLEGVVPPSPLPVSNLSQQSANRHPQPRASHAPSSKGPRSKSQAAGLELVAQALARTALRHDVNLDEPGSGTDIGSDPPSSQFSRSKTEDRMLVYKEAIEEVSAAISHNAADGDDHLLIKEVVAKGSFGHVFKGVWRGMVSPAAGVIPQLAHIRVHRAEGLEAH